MSCHLLKKFSFFFSTSRWVTNFAKRQRIFRLFLKPPLKWQKRDCEHFSCFRIVILLSPSTNYFTRFKFWSVLFACGHPKPSTSSTEITTLSNLENYSKTFFFKLSALHFPVLSKVWFRHAVRSIIPFYKDAIIANRKPSICISQEVD